MDWMYDGIQIQKEDYLLGKKVDKKFGESTDNNDTNLPPQICPTNNTFSQVDLTKKILEDPLVNIKKREIECTQKILQNPMRLKKQNVEKEKHTIEDHKLDMIIVSRLKSFQKAGLDLKEILSITKNKGKKEQKKKRKKDYSSSEEDEESDQDEKITNKQKIHVHKSNNFDREDKKSFEYRDHKRNGHKSRNERQASVSSSDDKGTYKRNKIINEFRNQRNSNHKSKDNHSERSPARDKNNQSSSKKRNERHRSTSVEKHEYLNERYSKNNYRNNLHKEEENKKKNEKLKYKHQEDKSRDRKYDKKRYESGSSDRELEQGKLNDTSEYSKYKSKSNDHNRLNSSDREHKSKDSKDSRNKHEYHKKLSKRKSRSESPQKPKNHQRTNTIKKNDHRSMSRSSSSSDDEKKNDSQMKHTSKHQHTAELELDNEKHVQHDKDEYKGRKDYGLFVPKGQIIKNSSHCPPPVKISNTTSNVKSKSPPVKKKKLTDEEMEKLRKEMMKDAKIRDKERYSNVKRYRNEEKKEEEKQKPYSKEFLIKQLAHAASQVTVERSIKSNVNKLQKNNNSIAD